MIRLEGVSKEFPGGSNAVLDLKVAYATPLLVLALVFFGLALLFSGVFR